MKPRLSTSKKWVSLPREYLQQINEVFTEKFKDSLQGSQIVTEGRIYSKELLLRVGCLKTHSLRQSNFETSIEYDGNKQNVISLTYKAIDLIDSMMDEYLSHHKETAFPRTWQVFHFEGQEIFLQYSTINTKLESHADQLLGETESNDLVQDDDNNSGGYKGET